MKRNFVLLALGAAAFGASTQTWELNTFSDFLKGRFTGVALSRDGRLRLAPKLETVFSSDQPAIWSVAEDQDGNLYLGTGHHGRLYRVDRSGKAALVWTADEPEIFAVAAGPNGALFAATSPRGKVYRIENGKAVEYFSPGATYIWSLAVGPDGALYVGTGEDGRIYRVSGPGQGELYYETGQSHVTCLAFDAAGRLLAGTEPNGILYRISGKDRAFVLYDATHPEIRALVPMPDGTIYAAALGGSVTKRVAAAASAPSSSPPLAAPPTSITVTAAQGGVEIKPKAEKPKPPAAPAAITPPAAPAIEIAGVEKSALYKIHPDNTVETLWTSTEENAYDLVADGDALLFTTDGQGRVYQLGPDRKLTLLAQTNESEGIRLLRRGRQMLVATGNMGKLFRLEQEHAQTGVYEAPVHDAGAVARWGRLSWRAETPPGARLEFQTRSGNTARPDRTWSDWSAPLTDGAGSPIQSPNARYIQWRATLKASGGQSPVIDSVSLAYLPQNTPPRVTNIDVSTKSAPPPAPATPQSSSTATYSITVTDTGAAGASSAAGTATQKLARAGAEQIQITWQAEDSDGDRLLYSLYFRGEGEREWKLMKREIEETSVALDANALADGKYYFRVVASDAPANAPGSAREGELVSAPVLIDQTPPVVRLGAPRQSGGVIEVEAEAQDAASALRSCEYSLDAGRWTPLAALDGIIDSPEEKFLVRLVDLAPGEHLLVVRAFDAGGNAGLARVVIDRQ
jgi:sugar lactone lactonase YvrE